MECEIVREPESHFKPQKLWVPTYQFHSFHIAFLGSKAHHGLFLYPVDLRPAESWDLSLHRAESRPIMRTNSAILSSTSAPTDRAALFAA